MLKCNCTVIKDVEDKAEAVEFCNELREHYDGDPSVTVTALVTDDLKEPS